MLSDAKKTRNESDSHHRSHQRVPNEIVTLIISHISNRQKGTLHECALVSKQFHVIANPFLWKVLDFDNIHAARFFGCLSDTSPKRLETLAKPIRQLYLTGPLWTDTQLTRLLPHLPQLKHLTICLTSSITNKSVQHLPQHCPSLLSLTLALPYFNDTFFAALGHHCRQLSSLECNTWSHPSSLALLTGCPLERLKINSGASLNEKARAALWSFDLVYLDLHVPKVERLISSHAWPRLTCLTLFRCKLLDKAAFIMFFRSHPHLTRLDLKYPENLTQTTLDAMTRWLPHLASVTIYGNTHLSNDGVRRWVQHSPSLICAKFYYCTLLSSDAFPESQQSDHILVHLDQPAIDKIKSTTTLSCDRSGVV